ncbi:hypothetical protein CVT24_008664 [Panaeolus cyanescens]|uniref:Uncharacterized protein n=1 Tax=Panaeolus cyanescens TaxID=181874 RepID=A0A409WWR0_9AGAR|nr:hypothetical protein CVT24_008664 [Panaeolus cyanescens]
MQRLRQFCLYFALSSGLTLVSGQLIQVPTLLPVISSPTSEGGNGVVGVVVLPGLSGQSHYSYSDSVQGAEATAQAQSLEPLRGINGNGLLNPPVPFPPPPLSSSRLAATISSNAASPTQSPNGQPASISDTSATDSSSGALLSNVNTLPLAPAQFQLPTTGVLTTASGKPIPCSPKSTHLNPTTHKFISECTESTFCLAPPGSASNATRNGVCARRRCRRDMYPFGFFGTEGSEMVLNTNTNLSSSTKKTKQKKKSPITRQGPFLPPDLPPICPEGTFCPDDGSGCLPQVSLGAACELARDEQCALPPNMIDGASLTTGVGKAAKPIPSRPRGICLDRTCMSASQTLSEPCVLENTTYVSDIDKGQAGAGLFTSHIIRDNCLSPTFYCSLEGVTAPLTKAKMAPPIGGFAFSTGKYKLVENGVLIGKGTCKRTKLLGEACAWDAMCETHHSLLVTISNDILHVCG